MDNLKVLIVEDEYPIALDLELKITELGFKAVGIASSWGEVNLIMEEILPDIVLMDINLGDKESGIDIAERIFKDYSKPVVFLTANSGEALVGKALQTNPFGYLIKPYRVEELRTSILVAYNRWRDWSESLTKGAVANKVSLNAKQDDVVFIKQGTKIVKIQLDEILYVQALDNYSMIYTDVNRFVVNSFLSDLLTNLNGQNLIRTHRSYAVNKNKIASVEESTVFINEIPIPISRSFKKSFLQTLNII